MGKAKNDLGAPVPKFCLTLEEFRRTPEGRVRPSQELLAHFFTYDEKSATDRVFCHLPNEVRGPILSGWGIRGLKAALRDDDAKVAAVVQDALLAGDIDHAAFEEGLPAETLVSWVPLASIWAFWRGGKLSKKALGRALECAYDLGLFDARWFLDTLEGRGGKLRGTDVIAEGLTKADLTEWIRNVHKSGDGSARGLVTALGWEKIVTQTANDILVSVLDAMAAKVGLAPKGDAPPKVEAEPEADAGSLTDEGLVVDVEEEAAAAPPAAPKSLTPASPSKRPEPLGGKRRSIPAEPPAVEDDEEDENEQTAVFATDAPRPRGG